MTDNQVSLDNLLESLQEGDEKKRGIPDILGWCQGAASSLFQEGEGKLYTTQ